MTALQDPPPSFHECVTNGKNRNVVNDVAHHQTLTAWKILILNSRSDCWELSLSQKVLVKHLN